MGFPFNDGMGFFPGAGFSIIFFLIFGIIIAFFLIIIVRSLMTWNKNNHSPRLTVDATVVSRRVNVSHHHNGSDNGMHSSSSWYYVTFQVASGDRMELQVDGSEYGMLAEGDNGQLTFQGSRYLEFKRIY